MLNLTAPITETSVVFQMPHILKLSFWGKYRAWIAGTQTKMHFITLVLFPRTEVSETTELKENLSLIHLD